MPMYGVEHLLALAAIAVFTVVAIIWARKSKNPDPVLKTAGWAYLLLGLGWVVWDFLPQNFTLEQSIPIHLSDVLKIITAIALITRAHWAVAITYYWGLTLNIQSLLTPDLNYIVAPKTEFVSYWLFHGLALAVPLVLIIGLGFRPTWRSLAIGFGGLLAWAGAASVVNALTDANYGYLAHAPAGPSLLDLMGGWPLYLVVAGVVILAVWSLMTLPFVLAARRRRS